jgi:hypothetical protein
VVPRDHPPLLIEACAQALRADRVVVAVTDVILAGPLQANRRADLARHEGGLRDEVRLRLAPETSAEERDVPRSRARRSRPAGSAPQVRGEVGEGFGTEWREQIDERAGMAGGEVRRGMGGEVLVVASLELAQDLVRDLRALGFVEEGQRGGEGDAAIPGRERALRSEQCHRDQRRPGRQRDHVRRCSLCVSPPGRWNMDTRSLSQGLQYQLRCLPSAQASRSRAIPWPWAPSTRIAAPRV